LNRGFALEVEENVDVPRRYAQSSALSEWR
jgi:hypothetical protein